MRIIGANIGHDICLSIVEGGTCIYFEDLSRTFRKKQMSFNLAEDLQHDQCLLAHCRGVADSLAAGHWAITLNPLSPQHLEQSLLLVEELVGSPPEHSPGELLSTLLKNGHARFNAKCTLIEHGIAHVAAAWFTSGFDTTKRTLAISLDGWSTSSPDTIGVFGASIIDAQWRRQVFPVCGSYFDTYLSTLLYGAPSLTAAGKIMGYAAHGEFDDAVCRYIVKRVLPRIDPRRHSSVTELEREALEAASDTRRDMPYLDASCADHTRDSRVQTFYRTAHDVFTSHVVDTILSLVQSHDPAQLLYSGGCALSITTNSRLLEALPDEVTLYIPPFANDLGQAYGAARLLAAFRGAPANPDDGLFRPFLGRLAPPIENLPDNVAFIEMDYDPMALATEIAHGATLAWYEGAYAVGPRALGDRSLLASPARKGTAAFLSAHVKQREWYRPYGPVVLQEEAVRLFGTTLESPYMLFEPTPAPEQRPALSECLSPRGTCRVQTLITDWKPQLAGFLIAVRQVTGTAALLNTSLNQAGMPIADSLVDAANAAHDMALDFLYADGRLFRQLRRT